MILLRSLAGFGGGLRGRSLPLVFLLLLFFPSGAPLAHDSGHKHVLILHSFHAGLSWTDGIMEGMQNVLAEAAEDIQVHVEYLDTKRYQNPDYFSSILETILTYKLEGRAFDLVLLSDNAALDFALQQRDGLFRETPIIFCGINNDTFSGGSGIQNASGVAELPAFADTIELALRLHPKTEEIVYVGSSRDATDLVNRNLLLKVLPVFKDRVRFVLWEDLPVENLKEQLVRLPKESLVLLGGSMTDRSGHVLPSFQAARQVRQASPVPVYGFWDSFLGQGIVGGRLIRSEMQGEMAARLAVRVLHGENPDDITVVSSGTSQFMFDYKELDRFGVSMALLPEDSVVINRPPPFYALSRGQLWSGLGVMTVLAGFLLLSLLGRKKAERALRESEARVSLLLNSTAEGIYGLDLQGNCTFCNPAAVRLLGYEDAKDLLGKNMHALTHHTRPDGSHYPAEECRICQAFHQNEGFHHDDEVFWCREGGSFLVEYWAYPLQKNNEPIGAVVSFLDVTERKQAEDRLKEANRELDAFAYTVSHDLRGPLTAIIGFAEFLKEEHGRRMDEEVLDVLTVIEEQGHRMVVLMDDLLALARTGKLERPATTVNVSRVADEVLVALQGQIARSGLRIEKGQLPDLRVPETLLFQVFENLIGNALQHAGCEGGPIEVGGERHDTGVCFYVRDHGAGIPENERNRIFEVFYRVPGEGKTKGTGVGLATVQKIAHLYGGQSWVEETPGGGSTFRVEMLG